jgi:hypothetical protein
MGKDAARHTGRGPGRCVSRRHDAGVGEAGFLCDVLVPFNDDHVVTGMRQKICGANAYDTAADYCNLFLRHLSAWILFEWDSREREDMSDSSDHGRRDIFF